MKRIMVLVQKENPSAAERKAAKKQAKQIKKAHETLWGPNTCEVILLEHGQRVELVAEQYESPLHNSLLFNGTVNPNQQG